MWRFPSVCASVANRSQHYSSPIAMVSRAIRFFPYAILTLVLRPSVPFSGPTPYPGKGRHDQSLCPARGCCRDVSRPSEGPVCSVLRRNVGAFFLLRDARAPDFLPDQALAVLGQ